MKFTDALAICTVACVLVACKQGETTSAPPLPYEGYTAFSERFRSPEVLCGTNKDCLDSPLIASSHEELAWLRSNGYPSLIQLRRLRGASTIVLEGEARQGSTNAMIVLGARLVAENRKTEGLEQLMQAARNGSIHALYELSNAHARGPALGDQLESAAFLRAAEMRGDWKAAIMFNRRFPVVGQFERAVIGDRAKFLLRDLDIDKHGVARPNGSQ